MEKRYVLMQDGVAIQKDLDYDAAWEYFVFYGSFSNKGLVIEKDGYFS